MKRRPTLKLPREDDIRLQRLYLARDALGLEAELHDRTDHAYRFRVTDYLSRMSSAEASAALMRLLCDGEHDPPILIRAVQGLRSEHAGVPAAQAVVALCRHPSVLVRQEALKALARLEVPGAEHILVGYLRDDDWVTRSIVAKALGSVGTQQAIDQLSLAIGDRHSVVSTNAIWAIEKIGGQEALRALSVWGRKRAAWPSRGPLRRARRRLIRNSRAG